MTEKQTRRDFVSDQEVRWCPGCGDYAILAAVQKCLADTGATPENSVFISGIGCSSRFPYYMKTYGFHSIHGRAPSIASGLKLSNPDLDVWVITGDGDALSIGGNHILHALRRNVDLNIILFNNKIYGLTKGQYSPTSSEGTKSPTTPFGSVDYPINPFSLALGSGATFFARAIDVDAKSLGPILQAAKAHKGTSLIEVTQNCPIFNDGVWDAVTNRKTATSNQLRLEEGKPLLFEGGQKGIRLGEGLTPEIVEVGEGKASESELLVHKADGSDAYHAMLASMAAPEFPQPLGILKQVARPSYDELALAQVDQVLKERGKGDLNALLSSGMTWTVGPDGRPE
ncbi:MAG: 2-oxoacid:ferredoxin oxidoreductase subunit beta [Myxococcales bacterium]|nr:2-oxoacid:ferredoxin oxidoreductase subunit beta [Myxococcales bacterium]